MKIYSTSDAFFEGLRKALTPLYAVWHKLPYCRKVGVEIEEKHIRTTFTLCKDETILFTFPYECEVRTKCAVANIGKRIRAYRNGEELFLENVTF